MKMLWKKYETQFNSLYRYSKNRLIKLEDLKIYIRKMTEHLKEEMYLFLIYTNTKTFFKNGANLRSDQKDDSYEKKVTTVKISKHNCSPLKSKINIEG